MKIIKRLSNKIKEEINDSTCYAKMALEFRDSDQVLADVFNRLSIEEMNHMTLLHNEVVRIIHQYQQEHGDPPPHMQAIYDYLHQENIEAAAEAKSLQLMYKERINP